MGASPRDDQHPHKSRAITEAIAGYPRFPPDFPAELLLEIARNIEDTEDLQRLRLVSRAFSHAATTALQDRFTQIFILPLQSSMARFTKLTMNPLIGPKIRYVNVIYGQPVPALDIPPTCLNIAVRYEMQLQSMKDIMSEYNERYTDSTSADDDSTSRTAVGSRGFERVLGEGLRRLSKLCIVFMCRDALSALCSIGGTIPLLNLPEFLQVDVSGKRGGNKLDAIQHLTVAHYVKHEILQDLYGSCLGRVSPIEVLGALSQWPCESGERKPILWLCVPGLGSLDETAWATKLAQEPRLLNDSMVNLTCIDLLISCPRPPQTLVARLDASGEEHRELSQGSRWLTLVQAAVNLKCLQLRDRSEWSAGFDNLLQLIFETATWPTLTKIYISRDQNIGLLPCALHLFDYSPGWYLFLQSDLDRFLIRHKNTLESLVLHNIIGVTEHVPPPTISLQWPQPGFPSDPKPSFSAFERSLKLWRLELKGLTWADVEVAVEFFCGQKAAVERWIDESELHALASAEGVTIFSDIAVIGDHPLDSSFRKSSWVEVNWGEWLLDRECGAV
jgi:hypothetical protein